MHISVNSLCPTAAENYSKTGTGKQHTGLKAKKIFLQFLPTHQLLRSAVETEAAIISGGNLAYHSLGFISSLFSPLLEGLIFDFKKKLFQKAFYLAIATKLLTI